MPKIKVSFIGLGRVFNHYLFIIKKFKLNNLIHKDYLVHISSITDQELDDNPELVRTMSVKPPRGSGQIRMVKIGDDIDFQPCGGTHVNKTSEINLVKSVKIENKGKMNKRIIITF